MQSIKVIENRIAQILLFIGLFAVSAFSSTNGAVDKLLVEAYTKGQFSGVVVVSKDNKMIYQKAVGLADRRFSIPNTVATKFRICSVTKQFTAVLVMQLVEAGKVSLDKHISDYLPDFRKETGGKVTVRDLLLSASGLPQLPDEFYVSEDARSADAGYVINKYLQGDLAFTPGDKFNYNNADFIILGEIISKQYGKPYEAVLREKILDPLGMKGSGSLKNEDIIPGLASGYSFKDGKFLSESFVQIQNFGSSGAMYSTAGDMLKWDDALLNNKLLSEKYTEEMFTPSPKLGFVGLGSWAYGLKFANGKKVKVVERQGYINGFCTLNVLIPEMKFSAVFLSNSETQTLFQTYAARGLSFEVVNEFFRGSR